MNHIHVVITGKKKIRDLNPEPWSLWSGVSTYQGGRYLIIGNQTQDPGLVLYSY